MTSETTHPYRLRLPGPTAVPPRILQAMAAPMVAHRGPEFKDVLGEALSLAQTVLGTSNQVHAFTSSGTGMMEAAVANLIGPGDKALILSHGQFGERFAMIAEAIGADADLLEMPWGEAVGAEQVAERLASADYKAVIGVHNESSTGAVLDLKAVGAVVRETPAVFAVDSVSGLAGLEMHQDEWGVDVVVSASQKALMCPPGLGLASISDKAWRVIEAGDRKARFYFDFLRARDASENGQTAFTSPVPLVYALREALRMIHEEGWPNVLARHRRNAAALRAGGEALGLPLFTKAPILSETVCVFAVPEERDGVAVIRHLYETYNTVVAGARNRLKGKVVRIGTMGGCTADDVRTDLDYLEQTLTALGWPVEKGAGLTAAESMLCEAA